MDGITANAAAELTGQRFNSFSDATRAVLEMLEQQLPGSAVFVGHFDEGETFRIVDSRGDASFDLEAGTTVDLNETFCIRMATQQAPSLTTNAAADPVYGKLALQDEMDIGSYAGVPLELGGGEKIGSLCAIAHDIEAFTESDLQLLRVLGNLLAYQLERDQQRRDLEALTRQLREQATTDGLTALLNRATFDEALRREWSLSNRDGIPSFLIVFDLDGFKQLNDEHGHAAGDEALKGFAGALRSVTRDTDLVGRIGGDEFAVVLVRAQSEDACELLVERLRGALDQLSAASPLGVSAGCVRLPEQESPEAARELADAAMYEDKRRRRAAR